MYHNYPHKRRVLCLKTLQAALNCCSSRCSLNHCSTCYHMNYWLFVSFLQVQRFCSVSTLLCRANMFFASSWISAVYLCSYTHLSLFFSGLLCPSGRSETRGSAECDAADGYVDWSGIRDEVPHWNGLRPQAAGCTQGERGSVTWACACAQQEEETLIFFEWVYLRRCCRTWNHSPPAFVLVPGAIKALMRSSKVLSVEMLPVWLPRLLCLYLRCSSTPTWAARCLASDPFRRTRLRLFTPHW